MDGSSSEAQKLKARLASLPLERKICLGLNKVKEVAMALDLMPEDKTQVVIIAGTNGKGSTAKTLTHLAKTFSVSVGTFTSPHLYQFNERIALNGTPASDKLINEAFDLVSQHQKAKALSYFEWSVLVAMAVFKKQKLALWVLEVGLGGRLDATNIVDANLAIITGIGFDHMDYLGETLEEIALEKAGVFRKGQKIVCADTFVNSVFIDKAKNLAAKIYLQNQDFCLSEEAKGLYYQDNHQSFSLLAQPKLKLSNIAIALKAWLLLGFDFDAAAFTKSMASLSLPFRQQWLSDKLLLDASHNEQSVAYLADTLKKLPNKVDMVFSMLKDKEILPCLKQLKAVVKSWYVAPCQNIRTKTVDELRQDFQQAGIEKVTYCKTAKAAFLAATSQTNGIDVIVVAGSFFFTSEIAAFIESQQQSEYKINNSRSPQELLI